MDTQAVCESMETPSEYLKRVHSVSQDVQYLMWLLRDRTRHMSRTMSWEYVAMGISEINEVARCASDLVRELDRREAPRSPGLQPGPSLMYMQTLLRTVASPRMALRFDVKSGSLPVPVSEPALQQIMINLISNSRNAGAKEVSISIAQERVGKGGRAWGSGADVARIIVSDDGCGLAEDFLEDSPELHVFDDEPAWFGSGLSTVQGIVRASGGEFGVRNAHRGLLAEVRLPVLAPESLSTPEVIGASE